MTDPYLPPSLASRVHDQRDDEDDAPPCIGERFRDITHDIHRAAFEAQQEALDHD
jgi:hypothetical protein